MKSLNEQYNLPVSDNGLTTYNPHLYNGWGTGADIHTVHTPPIVTGGVYKNADGSENKNGWERDKTWLNCGGAPMQDANGNWTNATGDCSGITASTPLKGVVSCVNGRAIYIPAIWMGLKLTQKGREKIEHNRCVCLKKKEARKPNDVAPTDGIVDDGSYNGTEVTPKGTRTNGTTEGGNGTTNTSGMSTGAKIGIGVGAVALIVVAVIVIKKMRKNK